MNRPTSPDRRAFVLGLGAAAVLGACGGGGSAGTAEGTSEPVPDTEDDGSRLLQPAFADGFRAPSTLVAGGEQRAPFILSGPDGLPAVNGIPDVIEATLTLPDGSTAAVELPRRGAGLAVPHYPLVFAAPAAGDYLLDVVVGDAAQQLQFRVVEPTEVGLVAIGEAMRSVATPTTADPLGVDPICTRFEPCPFHTESLADVLGNGRPTALIIATPGFCQTASCGPVVDLLVELDPRATMNVVHAEVYTEPAKLAEVGIVPELLTPVITTYAMDFEPSLIVADATGTVTARLDYSFDRDEIAEALATANG